jgi:HD-like signal output (HDOD) protein
MQKSLRSFAGESPTPVPEPPAVGGGAVSGPIRAFLTQLATREETADPATFSAGDQIFLSAILRQQAENKLHVPMLPRVAMEITGLLKNPDTKAGRFAELLQSDAALSVEVLRIANSALSASARTTDSVHEAVIRIGLNRLQAVVIAAFVHGKVMKAGSCTREAHCLAALTQSMAEVARRMGRDIELPPEVAFTRGLLFHVEHFILLDALNQVSITERQKLPPSHDLMIEAFLRFGPTMRNLAAKGWGLEHLLVDPPDSAIPRRFTQIRRLVLSLWLDLDLLQEVDGVPPDRLERGLRGAGPVPACFR